MTEQQRQPDATALRGEPIALGAEVAPPHQASVDPRIMAAWQQWLNALATDPEAAIAAAQVYGELSSEARDAWLNALAEDAPKIKVPAYAIYAPLLSVESDPVRRLRMEAAMDRDLASAPSAQEQLRATRSLRGIGPNGARIAALVVPLYLRFVRVLWCRYTPYDGFQWVQHDPILRDVDAPTEGSSVDGIVFENTPMKLVVEELAHAILAQRRKGSEIPASLFLFANLFDAQEDDVDVSVLPSLEAPPT